MTQIVPIKELKNTAKISELCHSSDEPVYITKNGYGDMVIMSIEVYENTMQNPDKAKPSVVKLKAEKASTDADSEDYEDDEDDEALEHLKSFLRVSNQDSPVSGGGS